MPSVHLAEYYRKLICTSTWERILPIKKKNQVIFRSYLTVEDTRFQADHCWDNSLFSILFLGLEFLLPKCTLQNADTKMPIYQHGGVVHNILNFREDFNKTFVLKLALNSRLRDFYTVGWRQQQSILTMFLYSFPAGLDKVLACPGIVLLFLYEWM